MGRYLAIFQAKPPLETQLNGKNMSQSHSFVGTRVTVGRPVEWVLKWVPLGCYCQRAIGNPPLPPPTIKGFPISLPDSHQY